MDRPEGGVPDEQTVLGSVEEEEEATEVIHRRVKAVQEQMARRTSGPPAEDAEDVGPLPEVDWRPPPEATPDARRSWLRFGLFVLALLLGYGAFNVVTNLFFSPRLEIVGPHVPDGWVEPGRDVRIGLLVRNVRSRDGLAYVAMVRDQEAQVDGPVVTVPGGDSMLVPLAASFAPGDHVVTLILYDAWRSNDRVDAVSGVLVRAGEPQIRVSDVALPDSTPVADALTMSVELTNPGPRHERVTPVVVVVRPPEATAVLELDGPLLEVGPGETIRRTFEVGPMRLRPDDYTVAVVLVSSHGDRIGTGLHGLAWRVHG